MNGAAFLTAQGVSVKLAGRMVLKDISVSLSPGHLVALVGPNGAGKTTLLRGLAGLVPAAGAIHVGGEALSSLSLPERARRFAYLPQGHLVHWPLPARDIVALGRYPHGTTDPARLTPSDAEAVLRAMRATDVLEFSERRVTELSGGERSRVALARVLAVEAPVIFADEPTSSLDPRHQIDVMKTLRTAADQGTLVMVVTHDLWLAARFADTVLVLSEGRRGSQGGPTAARSACGRVLMMDLALLAWFCVPATAVMLGGLVVSLEMGWNFMEAMFAPAKPIRSASAEVALSFAPVFMPMRVRGGLLGRLFP